MTHPGDLLHAYLDNELDSGRALEIHQHLTTCDACRCELVSAQRVREAVKRFGRAEPSDALLRRLRPKKNRAPLVLLTASAAAVLVLISALVLRSPRPDFAQAHAAALMAAHTIDVVSSDRHTVKPWFQGKVPYSLPVQDFADQGFTLEGARLQAVGGRTYAVLVYRHQAHVIDAFAWPEDLPAPVSPMLGYHLVAAATQGTHFVLVSDASHETLASLAALISAEQ
jgi:anti-sigma factor RsiW